MDKAIGIVTGGTGGIGSAICQRLSEDCKVIACYFKDGCHDAAREWQKQQKNNGFDIDIIYADVANFENCELLVNLVVEKYGKIDILVNNAGITWDVSLKNMTVEQWQKVIDTNLTSIFNMTRNILPPMLANGWGRVINISSINGRKGQRGQCHYAASKAALYGFTKSLAQEVAAKGITVNSISPGYIATAMLTTLKDDILQNIINNIPVGRLGEAQEIAEAVAFFASPKSGFITGANLDINGGQYM